MKWFNHPIARILLAVSLLLSIAADPPPENSTSVDPAAVVSPKLFIPVVMSRTSGPTGVGSDWPQLAHDPQRTGHTPEQVDPPYCYEWKWNAVPFASRVQPVVKNGLLFIGGLDGRLYARNATSGEPVWSFTTDGPIRHTAAVAGSMVITGSYDGYTYALSTQTGDPVWQTWTGSSATAPLVDESNQRVFVASTYGTLTALNLTNGSQLWQYDAKAPILTSPSLSPDGSLVFFGSESINAIAVNASTGGLVWKTKLQGQSLAERFPVVAGDAVIYRSQPYYFFYAMIQTWGDTSWIRPAGSTAIGQSIGPMSNPKLSTSSTRNPPSKPSLCSMPPMVPHAAQPQFFTPMVLTTSPMSPSWPIPAPTSPTAPGTAFKPIFPGTIHVTTKYDAELGRMNLNSLDITGLTASTPLKVPLTGGASFRMTSDEAAMLTMGGDILWVDNWERLGGINVSTGQIVHAGNVSNDWPECFAQCGPAGPRPFYPLSGNPSDQAYPFPGPRASEGHARAGVVIANSMVYWRVVDAGLAAFSHSNSSNCAASDGVDGCWRPTLPDQ